MKKLLLSLTAITLVTSSAVTVVSCNYIDTVQVSVNNKINEVMKSTSHFFKPAILANENGFSRKKVKSFLNSKKLADVEANSNDTITVKKQLNMFFDSNHLTEFENKNFVNNENGDDFEGKEEESQAGGIIELISGLFNTIYGIVGEGFSPRLIETLFEMVDFSEFQGTIGNLNDTLKDIGQFNPVKKIKEDLKGVEVSYQTIKTYTLLNLLFFIDDSFSETINAHEPEKLLTMNEFNKYAKNTFAKILGKEKFEFKMNSIQNIIQFIYGIGWYVEAFDEHKIPFETVVDDNHLFSNALNNIEVFREVNKIKPNIDMLPLNLNNTFYLLYAIFNSDLNDKESYEVSRILKLLFQVDEDTNMDLVEDPEGKGKGPYTLKMNLKLRTVWPGIPTGVMSGGSWGSYENSFKDGGLITPIINSAINGILFEFLDSEFSSVVTALIDPTVPISIGNLISSILANNNLNNFFIDFSENPGDLDGILNLLAALGLPPAEEIKKMIKSIGTSGIVNKPFTQIMNGDLLGQLIEMITGSPSSIRNISDLMNFKIFDFLKVGQTLTSIFQIVSVAPEFIFKLKDALEKISTFQFNEDYTFTDPMNIERKVSEIIWNPANEDGIVRDFELASRMLTYTSWDGWIVTKNGTEEVYVGSEFASMLLGISKDSTFIEGGILDSVSKLWDGNSGYVITTLMKTIKNLLDALQTTIPSDSNEKKYMKYLEASNFDLSILDYSNFENSSEESKLVYEIAYKNIDGNSIKKYKVTLKLPPRLNSFDEIKYEIESFEIV